MKRYFLHFNEFKFIFSLMSYLRNLCLLQGLEEDIFLFSFRGFIVVLVTYACDVSGIEFLYDIGGVDKGHHSAQYHILKGPFFPTVLYGHLCHKSNDYIAECVSGQSILFLFQSF